MVPLLRFGDILVASIQVDLTDEAAVAFRSHLLHKINDEHAQGVIIDVTSLDVVDSFMASILNDTASMARLLGAKVVLTGIQPTVALTLVEMGRELIGVETALSLQQGIDKLQRPKPVRNDGTTTDLEGCNADEPR